MSTTTTASVPTTTNVADLEVHADRLDAGRAAAIYAEHGALVVRGLMTPYVDAIARDVAQVVEESVALLPKAEKNVDGWMTPNGTLFIPAPEGFHRDKQVMVTGLRYRSSAAFFRSAFDERLVEVVSAILGPNVELFMDGQCLVKEPVGGHAKNLHQDGAYFEHRVEGPVAVLNYVVPTTLENGALHVVPGSHRLGMLEHVDTSSHLGLDPQDWPWEKAVPITGEPGDAIFFHVKTIHGSKPNFSEAPRPVFIHRYRRPDDYVIVNATSADSRKDAEKNAAHRVKEGQEGYMVCGFRSAFAGEDAAPAG